MTGIAQFIQHQNQREMKNEQRQRQPQLKNVLENNPWVLRKPGEPAGPLSARAQHFKSPLKNGTNGQKCGEIQKKLWCKLPISSYWEKLAHIYFQPNSSQIYWEKNKGILHRLRAIAALEGKSGGGTTLPLPALNRRKTSSRKLSVLQFKKKHKKQHRLCYWFQR